MSRQQKLAIQRGSAVAFILTIAALLFAFGFIAQEVATGKTSAFDRQITTLVVAGYLFLAGKSAVAWLVLIAVLGGIALSDLLKFAFGRARPDVVPPLARVFTTSFPSGHATLSAITYLTIGAVLARSQPSHTISLYFMSLAVFMTVLIGISRIYLGVHYPTDVLGGWCIGAAWAMGCWTIMAYLQSVGQIQPSSPL
jgi:undecaprenyl-diphosphatase